VDERTLPPPPSGQPAAEVCYRHANVPTGVHCTRCERPICPDCMNAAPVGHHCPTCVAEARQEFRRGPGRRIAIANAKATSVTSLILVAISAMFLLESVTDRDLGSAVPAEIAAGQWWRLLSSIFLHGGVVHLLLNGWSLYIFGPVIERIFGRTRMLVFFLVAGFVGSVASYAVPPAGPSMVDELFRPSVGASGALFGLVGALLVHSYRRRDSAVGRQFLQWAIMIIVLNLFIGFSVPRIDNLAHIGGAIGGAACAAVAELLGRRRSLERAGYAAIVVVGVAVAALQTAAIRETFPQIAGLL